MLGGRRSHLCWQQDDLGPFSFDDHFRHFVKAMTNAAVFKAAPCRAINGDAIDVEAGKFDLVYIDPPYINRNGVGVDYHGFYHFLEGLADYTNWATADRSFVQTSPADSRSLARDK